MATIFVWALIVKHIVSITGTHDADGTSYVQAPLPGAPATPDALLLDYRDPFTNKPAPKAKEKELAGQAPDIVELMPQFPQIQFKGVVANGKTLYGIISTRIGTDLIKQGESFDNFIVRSVDADSIVFEQGKFRYSVYRQ